MNYLLYKQSNLDIHKPKENGIYDVRMISSNGRNIRTDKANWNGNSFDNSINFGLTDKQITHFKNK